MPDDSLHIEALRRQFAPLSLAQLDTKQAVAVMRSSDTVNGDSTGFGGTNDGVSNDGTPVDSYLVWIL